MLSTISGYYFAGHTPIQMSVTPPPSGSGSVNFSIPGSATNGGLTVTNLGTSTNVPQFTATSPLTVVTSPTPAYMIAPGGLSGVSIPSSDLMTPSSQRQGAVTMWLYVPSANVVANNSAACISYAGQNFDGIYMFGTSDSSKNIRLHVTTNGQASNNTQIVPLPYYLPKDQWVMLTFVYIMNNTAPSSVWYNDTLVHSWTHQADAMSPGTYNLQMDLFGFWRGRVNNVMITTAGYTQAQVSAKFTSERSYYGV